NTNVNEGSAYTLTVGAVTDPGTDTVTSYTIHWGDTNSTTISAASLATALGLVEHTYADEANSYAITVDLTDEDGTFLDQANALSVTVDDVAPVITSGTTGSEAENTAATNMVYDADATDYDDVVSFSLSGTDAILFSIDSVTGAVRFLVSPNFEAPADAGTNNVYDVVVHANNGVLDTTLAVAISVTDVNEFAVSTPTDTNVTTDAINENVALGTTVGVTAFASDADATTNTVSYSLTSNPGGLFTIDPTTGVVTTAAAINRETVGASVTIQVTATSADTSTAAQNFTILINDLNEFAVSTPTDTNVTANAVNENVALGTTVGVTAFASDADATTNTVTYSLTSNPGGLFTIDPTTGVVTTAAAINRETVGASVTIQVTATSADTSTAAQTFTILINDLNEFAVSTPVDTNATTNAVNENVALGTTVGLTAFASDADATTNTVTYSLTSNPGSLFTIDPTTGVVTTAAAINRETVGASVTIQVTATSADTSTATQNFTILINDLNDVTPVVTAGQSVSIAEGSANGTNVLTLAATDGDATATTFQNWTITAGNTSVDGDLNLPFAINGSTGMITVNDSSDLNGSMVTFNLSVTVSDGVHTSVVQTVAVNVVTTAASVSGGVLTITDTGTPSNQPIDMHLVGPNLIIHDPNNVIGAGAGVTQIDPHTISIPFASLTQFVVNAGGGDDTLTIDFAGGNPIPSGGLIFNGGTGGHDTLNLIHVGSLFDTQVFSYANRNDGTVALINGGAGGIAGGTTSTVIYTGLEPISIDGTPTSIIFNLTAGADTNVILDDIGGPDGFLRLSGATFETTDFMIGAATSLTINGLGGNDSITVKHLDSTFSGSLTIDGGSGKDNINSSAVNYSVTLLGGTGDDRLTSGGGADSLNGGADKDTLKSGAGNDTLAGGTGDDYLNGELGVDCLLDVIGGNAKLTNTKLLSSSNGTDTLVSLECFEISGDSGNNVLDASGYTLGSVTLRGQDGNDTLLGGSGDDLLDGGNGTDQVKQTSAFNQTLTGVLLVGNGSDTLTSIERANLTAKSALGNTVDASAFNGLTTLNGGNGPDRLLASITGSVINGGSGNDTIVGGIGADSINGGADNDSITGGNGNDSIVGGTGNDVIDGGIGADVISGNDGRDKLFGGDGDDTIDGGANEDTISGGAGNDSILGGSGNDAISGGSANDFIDGQAGNDTLLGDDGNDILRGNAGRDVCLGGDGNDNVDGGADRDTVAGGPGDDAVLALSEIDEAFTFDFNMLLV
ncbi:MAG: cadherin domain-containing protein, partial [Planctomycetia bacterium]|nr:cadherin domain-containing protein [Planctomycetia bacterium]